MSPIFLNEGMDIDSVAVIGAGPCGLAAAKYLAAERKFSRITVFEQRATVGGVWNHTPLNMVDDEFTIPRTQPSKLPDTALRIPDRPETQFVSPVYDFLETNIPHHLMNYSDQPFPEGSSLFPNHAVVHDYLQQYAAQMKPMLSLQTQVQKISKVVDADRRQRWQVQLLDLKTEIRRTEVFDAIMIANGHYNDPFIPNIKGLAEFNQAHPGVVSHSKFYRRPDQYRGKKVIIVGHSASGLDLSVQIATVCQQPVLVSEKSKATKPAEDRPSIKMVPEIVEFLPQQRAVVFDNGEIEANIDAVVFCTGYFYSFPFFDPRELSLGPDGAWVQNLYEHIIYIDDPTLAFLGIPQRIVPFPVAEAQAGFVARIWADRLSLPTKSAMLSWEEHMLKTKGEGKFLHNLAFPKDFDYINHLHDLSTSAKRVEGIENDGSGKTPPYWGADKAWVRERFPAIKIASRALGDKRHEVKSLEELGFSYREWKISQDATQKIP